MRSNEQLSGRAGTEELKIHGYGRNRGWVKAVLQEFVSSKCQGIFLSLRKYVNSLNLSSFLCTWCVWEMGENVEAL